MLKSLREETEGKLQMPCLTSYLRRLGFSSTMRAEIVAHMIYLEGPEYPEYVMHIFYLKSFLGPPNTGIC